jgi:hypothetical protein
MELHRSCTRNNMSKTTGISLLLPFIYEQNAEYVRTATKDLKKSKKRRYDFLDSGLLNTSFKLLTHTLLEAK